MKVMKVFSFVVLTSGLARASDMEHLLNYLCKADAECDVSGRKIERALTMGECADKCNDEDWECRWFEWSHSRNCKIWERSSGEYKRRTNHLCCKKRWDERND